MEQIWIEKYRPNNLSEVVGQEAVTSRLKNYVKNSKVGEKQKLLKVEHYECIKWTTVPSV